MPIAEASGQRVGPQPRGVLCVRRGLSGRISCRGSARTIPRSDGGSTERIRGNALNGCAARPRSWHLDPNGSIETRHRAEHHGARALYTPGMGARHTGEDLRV